MVSILRENVSIRTARPTRKKCGSTRDMENSISQRRYTLLNVPYAIRYAKMWRTWVFTLQDALARERSKVRARRKGCSPSTDRKMGFLHSRTKMRPE